MSQSGPFDLEPGDCIAYLRAQVPEGQKGTHSAYIAAEDGLADASPLASPAHGH